MEGMQTPPTSDTAAAAITYPSDLSDAEWDYIKSLVPAPKSGKGRKDRPVKEERRTLLNAMFYITRAGCAWRYLPKEYGPWQTVYGYYRTWNKDWTWKFIHDTLRDYVRKSEGRAAAIIDSQSVKVPDQAGERGYDAGKKVSGRKRHLAVDCLGPILGIVITSAAVPDRVAAKTLITFLLRMFGRLQMIWADGGYL